jgi:hypothetical protein
MATSFRELLASGVVLVEGMPSPLVREIFFRVPARTVHRDVNPSSKEGQEIILFLRGSGPMVVNVEGPDPA